jgi:hypothetical protein
MASLSALQLIDQGSLWPQLMPCNGQKYDYVKNTSYMVLVSDPVIFRYGSDPHYP